MTLVGLKLDYGSSSVEASRTLGELPWPLSIRQQANPKRSQQSTFFRTTHALPLPLCDHCHSSNQGVQVSYPLLAIIAES
jgi:hypothetical protein